MFSRSTVLLLAALSVVGCDRISGAADQKIADAEAIGYACRVSLKNPEDCMKENEAQSPSSVLDGWKAAAKDIKDRKINADMSNSHPEVASEVVAGSAAVATDTAAKSSEEKPAELGSEKITSAPKKSEAADAHKPESH